MAPYDRQDMLRALCAEYLDAILMGHSNVAADLLMRAIDDEGVELHEVYHSVISPAQRALGRMWESGEISVAEEHLATATTQVVMAHLSQTVLRTPHEADRVLVAVCVEDDLHEVGLRMVADCFAIAGWETHYLGANTPTCGVLEVLRLRNARALAISAAMPEYLPQVRALVGAVKEHRDLRQVRVIVGGRAFDRDPEIKDWVGADLYASDAAQAIAWLEDPSGEPKSPEPTFVLQPTARRRANAPELDELMRLNNEMATLQRRFAQQSADLADRAERTQRHVGAAAEDLRAMASIVEGLSGQLASELTGTASPEQMHMLSVIQSSATYMTELLTDTLEVARDADIPPSLDRIRVDLVALVPSCVQRARHAASLRGVGLELELPGHAVGADVDVRRFEQIVDNLIGNALEVSPPGCTVRVRLEAAEQVVRLVVEDEGGQLSAEDRALVFQPFAPRRERSPSFGLAIARHLAEAHGGRVSVDPAARGSAFVVQFPWAA